MTTAIAPRPDAIPPGAGQESVEVLNQPARVRAALSPLRRRLLRELRTPSSASALAPRLGVTRQRLAYHLKVLEEQGLVRLVEERRRRGCTERLLRTSARALVVDPEVLGELPDEETVTRDRFSSAYLVAAAARLLGDVAVLREGAREAGKHLATVTQEAEIGFRSPAELRSFTEELAESVAALIEKYHVEQEGSRPYRLLIGMHPRRDPGTDASSEEGDLE